MSSFAGHSRFVILVLNALSRASLERDECDPDIILVHAKYHGLLASVVVLKADCKEVLPLLCKQEERREDDGSNVAAIHLLPVFQ